MGTDRNACLFFLLAGLLSGTALADSADDLFFKGTEQVNEGTLRFLPGPSEKPVHHHRNLITIYDHSLEDGWVGLEQCHENLDAVPDAQIVYKKEHVVDIEVIRTENIGRAWSDDSSVQLKDIGKDAVICIRARSHALSRNGEMSFNLSNGPYMRKFLDGYYPMQVSMTVRLDTRKLRFVESIPQEQTGFRIWQHSNEVGYEALFEGVLRTVLRFDCLE